VLSFTTKAAPISSTDQGGGKWRAKEDDRSLASYISRLIEADAEKKKKR
jgi:hypothetical protein